MNYPIIINKIGLAGSEALPLLLQLIKQYPADFKRLDEICDITGGCKNTAATRAYSKEEQQAVDVVDWYSLQDIPQEGAILKAATLQMPRAQVPNNKLFAANSILISTSRVIGNFALISTPHTATTSCYNLQIKDEYKHRVAVKYLYYYLFKVREQLINASYGLIKRVTTTELQALPIAVVPWAMQLLLIMILDELAENAAYVDATLPQAIKLNQQRLQMHRTNLCDFTKYARQRTITN